MAFTSSRLLAAGLFGILGLSGCAYDNGYGGMSVGAGYGGGGYYDDYYGPASYYNGWYDDYYYPGNGYYVYDRGGNRHQWNDNQRRYWEGRRNSRPEGQGHQPNPQPGQWGGNHDGNHDGNGQWRGNDNRNNNGNYNRPMTREDRQSVREFGATIEQRREADRQMNERAERRGGH